MFYRSIYIKLFYTTNAFWWPEFEHKTSSQHSHYCKTDTYRMQCSRCLLWLQLTLHLFGTSLYYSVSLHSLKAASTLQDNLPYNHIARWPGKQRKRFSPVSVPIQNYMRLAVFDFFAYGRTSRQTDRQTNRYCEANGRMFMAFIVFVLKRKNALRSHLYPFTKFYSFQQREFISNEKWRHLLAWLITVTTSSQRITSRPSAGIDPVLVWRLLSFSASLTPHLRLWHLRCLPSVELADNPLLSVHNHMAFPVI